MRFQYNIHHVPGKSLYIADTLSRAPLHEAVEATSCSSTETEQFIQVITAGLPASADHLEAFFKAQVNDSICSKLIEFCGHLEINLVEFLKNTGDFGVI